MTTPDENPDSPVEAQGRTPHTEEPAEGAVNPGDGSGSERTAHSGDPAEGPALVDGGPTQAPSREAREAAQTTAARDEQPE